MSDQPFRFKMTCGACPEQYDVFLGDKQVGYVRLRHGEMRVRCPDSSGITVYTAAPNGDGCFDGAEERDYFLRHAGAAIQKWLLLGDEAFVERHPPAPDVAYVLEDFQDWGADD